MLKPLNYTDADMAIAVADFQQAWLDTTGNEYYDRFDADKDGFPDSIEGIWAVEAAAAGIARRRMAMPPVPTGTQAPMKLTIQQMNGIIADIDIAAEDALRPYTA